jgi:hypothetical protein
MLASVLAPAAVIIVFALGRFALDVMKGRSAGFALYWNAQTVAMFAHVCVPASLITLLLHPEYRRRALARDGAGTPHTEANMAETGNDDPAPGGAAAPKKSSLVLWYNFVGPLIGVALFLLVSHGLRWLKLGYVPAFGQFGVSGSILSLTGMFGIGYLVALLPTALAGMVLMHVEARRPERLLAASVIAPVVIVVLFALFFGGFPGSRRAPGTGDLAWWTGEVGQMAAVCAGASLITVLLHPAWRRARRARDESAATRRQS